VAVAASCAEQPVDVPQRDQDAIFHAFVEEAQPLFRQGCFNVRRPVSEGTLGAYATLLKVARRDPEAIIHSPDFTDLEWTARGYVVARAEDIGYCMEHSPEVHPSWRQLQARLGREAAAVASRGSVVPSLRSPAP
jgi:hypothetical protein